MVMEYCSGGELFDHIVANTRLKEYEACKFYQQLLSGLEYLHRQGVVHRDLKPENLLLDDKINIKIVDFGLSNLYTPDQLLKTACGSPCYAAPEMIARKPYVPLKTDVWSSGVVLFAMVCGYLPFEDPNSSVLYQKIMNGTYKCPKFISVEVNDLINRILEVNPNNRISVERIKEHVWYRQVTQNFSYGIDLSEQRDQIDLKVLHRLAEHDIDIEATKQAIEDNQYTSDTATYFLLLKKSNKSKARSHSSEKQILKPRAEALNHSIGPMAPSKTKIANPRMKHRKFIANERVSGKKISMTGGESSNKKEFPKLKLVDTSFQGRSTLISPTNESFNRGRTPISSLRSKIGSLSPVSRKSVRAVIDFQKLITPKPPMKPRPPSITPTPQAVVFTGRRRVYTPIAADTSFE
mmetsp:Transcript_27281/g.49024  ORF Transcript_27281/g.49024 Transcript_27281/m.49024 type:complete len:408 (+) Transcript_27281:300-1523(+)